MLEIFKGQSY